MVQFSEDVFGDPRPCEFDLPTGFAVFIHLIAVDLELASSTIWQTSQFGTEVCSVIGSIVGAANICSRCS